MRLATTTTSIIILVAHQLLCIADAYVSVVPTRRRSGLTTTSAVRVHHHAPSSLCHYGRNRVIGGVRRCSPSLMVGSSSGSGSSSTTTSLGLMSEGLMSEDDSNEELSSINSNTSNDHDDDDDDANKNKNDSSSSSKREMLKFAIPALGIYLTNPLLSNIDNAFVGRTVGAVGLGKHNIYIYIIYKKLMCFVLRPRMVRMNELEGEFCNLLTITAIWGGR